MFLNQQRTIVARSLRSFSSSTALKTATKQPSGIFAATVATIPLAACTGLAFAMPETTWVALEVQSVVSTALLGVSGGVHIGLGAARWTPHFGSSGKSEPAIAPTSALFGVSPAAEANISEKTKKSDGGLLAVAMATLPVATAIGSAVLLNVPGALVVNAVALNLLLVAETASSSVPRWLGRAKAVGTVLATASIGAGLYLGYEHDRASKDGDEEE
ncbi:hypothetical protein BDR26DRAFT_850474 [Obelidium mucronatum]|nr:hypothetical protein BDR26DRAFT_850474 [Obelidium mucronatum]